MRLRIPRICAGEVLVQVGEPIKVGIAVCVRRIVLVKPVVHLPVIAHAVAVRIDKPRRRVRAGVVLVEVLELVDVGIAQVILKLNAAEVLVFPPITHAVRVRVGVNQDQIHIGDLSRDTDGTDRFVGGFVRPDALITVAVAPSLDPIRAGRNVNYVIGARLGDPVAVVRAPASGAGCRNDVDDTRLPSTAMLRHVRDASKDIGRIVGIVRVRVVHDLRVIGHAVTVGVGGGVEHLEERSSIQVRLRVNVPVRPSHVGSQDERPVGSDQIIAGE